MVKLKHMIKKFLNKLRKIFSKKIPTPYPVLEGELLKNRVALITGGSSGIGYAIAESFLKNGASVIITGRNLKKLEDSAKKLERFLKKEQFIKYFTLDISDTKNIEKDFNGIVENIDIKIDILINNAGISLGANIGNTEIDDFEKVFKTNVTGTYFLSQMMYNYMLKENIKGNILNIASSSSNRPAINAYAMSKWSLVGLTKGMAKKFIKDGIIVNGIAPGPTATPMLNQNSNEGIEKSNSPIGRYIMPEEIANFATILVSDLGKSVIGEVIYITGGAGTLTYDDLKY